MTKKGLAALEDVFRTSDPCEDHDTFAELRRDEDGYIVEMGCHTCNTVRGFMHPRSALDIAGADSPLGEVILSVFPEWRLGIQ